LLRADDTHEVLGDLLGCGIEGDDAYILGDKALQLGQKGILRPEERTMIPVQL
jgi:hypothetical protein